MEYKNEQYEADYKKMYLTLFNAVTDAIEMIDNGKASFAANYLGDAQRKCEEIYTGKE